MALLESDVCDLSVVLGYESRAIRTLLKGLDVNIVTNPCWPLLTPTERDRREHPGDFLDAVYMVTEQERTTRCPCQSLAYTLPEHRSA